MRNLLSLVGLLVVGFLGLGWYLGWYQLGVTQGSSGNTQIQFDVNTNKIKDDSRKGLDRVGDLVDGLKKETKDEKKDFIGPLLPGDPKVTTPPTSKSNPQLFPNSGR